MPVEAPGIWCMCRGNRHPSLSEPIVEVQRAGERSDERNGLAASAGEAVRLVDELLGALERHPKRLPDVAQRKPLVAQVPGGQPG
jgi:hypothetical protein